MDYVLHNWTKFPPPLPLSLNLLTTLISFRITQLKPNTTGVRVLSSEESPCEDSGEDSIMVRWCTISTDVPKWEDGQRLVLNQDIMEG